MLATSGENVTMATQMPDSIARGTSSPKRGRRCGTRPPTSTVVAAAVVQQVCSEWRLRTQGAARRA